MLLTSDGTFVYHPNADLIDTMIQDMNISDSVSTAISNQSEQLLKYKVNGEQKMEDSKKQMAQMREAMDKIQESSKQVVGVIKAIKDIASQTNLLSLNASIEAARAGEAGKGFAVVAEQIRLLADDSRKVANNIQDISLLVIESVEDLTGDSSKLIRYVDESILADYQKFVGITNEYRDDSEKVNNILEDFAKNTQILKNTMAEMNTGISDIATTIDDNTKGVNEAAESVSTVVDAIGVIKKQAYDNAKVGNDLSENVEVFKQM